MAGESDNPRPKGLLIPFDKLNVLNILDDAAFRQVFRSMVEYVQNGLEPDGLTPIEQVAFESVRSFLDENIKTYQRAVFAHREAGRKGGRPKKNYSNQQNLDETEENQQKPNGFFENQKGDKVQSTKYKVQSTNVLDISTATTGAGAPAHDNIDLDLARIVQHYEEVAGTFPRSAIEKLQGWRQVFGTEMILLAVDRAAEANKRSWAYINGILSGWQKDGVQTPGDARESTENHKNQPGRAGGSRKPAENVAEAYANIFKGVK